MRLRSIGVRVAAAAILVSALAVAVVAIGVLVIGASTFDRLMAEHGATAAVAGAMFDESVTRVLLVAAVLAIIGSLALGLLFGRMIERPLDEVAHAARQIAAGRYDIRVRRPSAPELASVADSFNQVAAGLQDQERQRRGRIQDLAHEHRAPLANPHSSPARLREQVGEAGPPALPPLE